MNQPVAFCGVRCVYSERSERKVPGVDVAEMIGAVSPVCRGATVVPICTADCVLTRMRIRIYAPQLWTCFFSTFVQRSSAIVAVSFDSFLPQRPRRAMFGFSHRHYMRHPLLPLTHRPANHISTRVYSPARRAAVHRRLRNYRTGWMQVSSALRGAPGEVRRDLDVYATLETVAGRIRLFSFVFRISNSFVPLQALYASTVSCSSYSSVTPV